MYRRMILNDLRQHKMMSATTFLFAAVCTMLLALAAMLFVHLAGAIDTLMESAMTPHYMQMHSGDLDKERLVDFAESEPAVQAFQILEFVNVDAGEITAAGRPFDGALQDNGMVRQSEEFDFLLDLDGQIIEAGEGKIYAPLIYLKNGSIRQGDEFALYGQTLTVAGFLRDSQMNSPLSSSKRFLLSDADFSIIREYGEMEYLIQFRFESTDDIRRVEALYASAGLESNGPALTYTLFRMINGLSDGLMIALILLMSLFVVMIAALCIRFMLLARMEEDLQEIGVLKAVGLHNRDIARLYLAKYALVSFVGCVTGYGAALVLRGPFTEDIRLTMGSHQMPGIETALGLFSALAVFTAVLLFVRHVLRRIRGVTVTEAIKYGMVPERSAMGKRFRLSRVRGLNSNGYMALKDILGRKKLYATMMLLFLISMLIMTFPQNLLSTVSSEQFITYMGIGKSDFRLDIHGTEHLFGRTGAILTALQADDDIQNHAVFSTGSYLVRDDQGQGMRLLIETGDHSQFPVAYSAGRMPQSPDEIALSGMNADEMGTDVGDRIVIEHRGEPVELLVTGIYSDISNGGKTAKARFTEPHETVMWTLVYADVQEGVELDRVVARYADTYPFAKVTSIDEFVLTTYGPLIQSMETASNVGMLVTVGIAFLVTLLFATMLVAKDRNAIAILKTVGHSNRDIRLQYIWRTLSIALGSIGLGIVVSITVGEQLAGLMISAFGATYFSFDIDRVFTYVVSPALMLLSVGTATFLGTRDVHRVSIAESIKE